MTHPTRTLAPLGPLGSQADALLDAPLRHMTISSNTSVTPAAPNGTVWVTLGDGTASPPEMGTAVPENGSSRSAGCRYSEGLVEDYCLTSIIKVGDEVRAFYRWNGQSCALIGSTERGKRTRLLCDSTEITL